VEEEISAFVVWHRAIGVVRVLALLKFNLQFLIFLIALLIEFEVVIKVLRTGQERESTVSRRMQYLLEEAFDVRGPTFVEPKV
jgi:membrane protein implicated in regulation of membrane protease activity